MFIEGVKNNKYSKIRGILIARPGGDDIKSMNQNEETLSLYNLKTTKIRQNNSIFLCTARD